MYISVSPTQSKLFDDIICDVIRVRSVLVGRNNSTVLHVICTNLNRQHNNLVSSVKQPVRLARMNASLASEYRAVPVCELQ